MYCTAPDALKVALLPGQIEVGVDEVIIAGPLLTETVIGENELVHAALDATTV